MKLANLLSRVRRWTSALDYQLHIARANIWRSAYNPLRGLTISRAVSHLEAGERGAYAELAWLYRYIERRNATLGSLVDRRLGAVAGLDWDIRVRDDLPKGMEAMAARQRQALRSGYERLSNLKEVVGFLALAAFRGFSHVRIDRDDRGMVTGLTPVRQWFWCREGVDGEWQLNPEARFGVTQGEDVEADDYIIREVERPINEVGLICHVRQGLSERDWDGFIETYGIPARYVELPPGLGDQERDAFQDLIEEQISGSAGVLPSGAQLHSLTVSQQGEAPFRAHLDYQNSQMVLRATGGQLTSLAEATGLGSGVAEVHERVFAELAAAEAELISELISGHLDAQMLLAAGHGDEPPLAYWTLAAKEETDISDWLEGVTKLSQAGWRVPAAQIAEKTGYDVEPAPPPPAAPVPGLWHRMEPERAIKANNRPPASPDETVEPDDEPENGILTEAMAPLAAQVAAGVRDALMSGRSMERVLQRLIDDLPELVEHPDLAAGPADVHERVIAQALLDGWEAAGDPGDEGRVMTNSRRRGGRACHVRRSGHALVKHRASEPMKAHSRGWYQIEVSGPVACEGPDDEEGWCLDVDPEALRSIVSHFHAEKEKENFSGLLIDQDHLSHEPDHDTTAVGWLLDVDIRNGQLWGLIEWTDVGRDLVGGKRVKWFSTEYPWADLETLPGRVLRPLRLSGLAVTNRPARPGGRPITHRAHARASTKRNTRSTMKTRKTKRGAITDALLNRRRVCNAEGSTQAEQDAAQEAVEAAVAEALTEADVPAEHVEAIAEEVAAEVVDAVDELSDDGLAAIAERLGLDGDADTDAILLAIDSLLQRIEELSDRSAGAEADELMNRFSDRLPADKAGRDKWRAFIMTNRDAAEAAISCLPVRRVEAGKRFRSPAPVSDTPPKPAEEPKGHARVLAALRAQRD